MSSRRMIKCSESFGVLSKRGTGLVGESQPLIASVSFWNCKALLYCTSRLIPLVIGPFHGPRDRSFIVASSMVVASHNAVLAPATRCLGVCGLKQNRLGR